MSCTRPFFSGQAIPTTCSVHFMEISNMTFNLPAQQTGGKQQYNNINTTTNNRRWTGTFYHRQVYFFDALTSVSAWLYALTHFSRHLKRSHILTLLLECSLEPGKACLADSTHFTITEYDVIHQPSAHSCYAALDIHQTRPWRLLYSMYAV